MRKVEVIINGEKNAIKDNQDVSSLLDELGVQCKVVAVSVNGNTIKSEQWNSTILADGDRVELLHFMGGGC